MILRRLGNKSAVSDKIQVYFPKHEIYIEPFFGAGGMFFNKPKAKYNIVNDLDSDVFNLFNVVSNRKTELEEAFSMMPIHSDLLAYWKENTEIDPIKKALRFLLISNFTLFGTGEALRLRGGDNAKAQLYQMINKTNHFVFDVQFANYDFRKFLKSIEHKENEFIYCDPPYLDTNDNYSHSFTEQDSSDLFDCLIDTGSKFAYSEFDHPFILEQAGARELNVITIGERQNLKNRRVEILVTNYKKPMSLFD